MPILVYSFKALAICFFVLMLAYILFFITRKHGIIDLFWGPSILTSILGCTAPSFVPYFIKKGFDLTSIGVFIFYSMIAIWAIRLTLFFLFRLLSSHDDRRYKKIIQSSSTRMFKQCLIQSFLQVLLVLTAYPLINESFTPSPSLMIISSIIFTIGFIGEWVSDDQLNRFKKNNRGLCNTGLWKYSRHPNYFFECLLWLGLSLLFLKSNYFWISLIGPTGIFIITYYITGPISERCSLERHGDNYIKYKSKTPYFFPKLSS